MNLLLYAGSTAKLRDRLIEAVSNLSGNVTMTQDHDGFTHLLRSNISVGRVIVFGASTPEDLSFLVSQKQFLNNARLVLILPDKSPEIISQGLSLYPRYQTHMDSDFKEVSAVLEKMAANEKKTRDESIT